MQNYFGGPVECPSHGFTYSNTKTFTAWHAEPGFMESVCLLLGGVVNGPCQKILYPIEGSFLAKFYGLTGNLHADEPPKVAAMVCQKNGLMYHQKGYAETESLTE